MLILMKMQCDKIVSVVISFLKNASLPGLFQHHQGISIPLYMHYFIFLTLLSEMGKTALFSSHVIGTQQIKETAILKF